VIDEVLALRGLRRFFPVVASTQDVGKTKPAPDVFLYAAKLLGVPPERCAVIEDSAAGVTAARAAGMTVIAITNSLPREQLAHADRIVDTYEELEHLLLPAAGAPQPADGSPVPPGR
jgi:beta-phosphoglucomutase-like phosphatase (HAD superfamily)